MLDRTPQIFISYSWTSEEYQNTVEDLAKRLVHNGVDVKLDLWDLKDGHDKYKFMEQCVSDPDIDKVLILCDKRYAEKADSRDGGVGDETTIISPEVYKGSVQEKFIPIVMERDDNGNAFLPIYLKSRMYRDLTSDRYEEEFEELLRTIFEAPSHRKPQLGTPPAWLTEETPDGLFPVKEMAMKVRATELGAPKNVAIHDFMDVYIEAIIQFYNPNPTEESYLSDFRKMKEYRDVFLDNLKGFSNSEVFGTSMAESFERLQNTLFNIKTYNPSGSSCGDLEFDIFRTHIWELFVCTVAFMLHYELYQDIHSLLVHTFFLRRSGLGTERTPICYEGFRFHSDMIEQVIKPTMEGDLPRKYTLQGHLVVTEREYLPIYSAKAIANADLFLYQVYNALNEKNSAWFYPWFPQLYIYADTTDTIWKKLVSKQYCEKLFPLFGVSSIDDLKISIAKCTRDRNICYHDVFSNPATAILDIVKLEDIATLT